VAADAGATILPFKKLDATEVKPFVNCVPVYGDLKVAAGRFSEPQTVDAAPQHGEVENPEDFDWAAYRGRTRPRRGFFVAQVVGTSMNKRIPDGAWCVWNLEHGCDGHSGDEIVLAQHSEFHDDDLGEFTVKHYRREVLDEDGEEVRVTLRPASNDEKHEDIALEGLAEGDLRIIAEFVEVLR
jgi:phage repressor protein C with HTH and peptisase S24 domain